MQSPNVFLQTKVPSRLQLPGSSRFQIPSIPSLSTPLIGAVQVTSLPTARETLIRPNPRFSNPNNLSPQQPTSQSNIGNPDFYLGVQSDQTSRSPSYLSQTYIEPPPSGVGAIALISPLVVVKTLSPSQQIIGINIALVNTFVPSPFPGIYADAQVRPKISPAFSQSKSSNAPATNLGNSAPTLVQNQNPSITSGGYIQNI